MAHSPAFQFYARDFIVGTIAMTTAQVGLYIRALAHQWDSGPLCTDEVELARTLSCSVAEFRKLWPAVSKKFTVTDAGYVNPRLEGERQKQEEFRARKASAGAKGGRPRKAEVISSFPETETKRKANESSASAICDLHTASAEDQRKERADRAGGARGDFERAWARYPRKVGKAKALAAWVKASPPIADVLAALAWQVTQPQWTKDRGEFVPHMATWLNQRRWEDEPFHAPSPAADEVDWFEECQRLHGGSCGSRYIHGAMPRSAVAS